MKYAVILMMIASAIFAEETYKIDATISVNSLSDAIKLVKSVDDLPVLSVRQEKMKSGSKIITSDGIEKDVEIDDPNTLIIDTGHIRGPLDGGGKMHHMKRQNDKWVITATAFWAS